MGFRLFSIISLFAAFSAFADEHCAEPQFDWKHAQSYVDRGFRIYFAPFVIPARESYRLVHDKKSPCFKEDFQDMSGYVALSVAKQKVMSSQWFISYEKFENELKKSLKPNPKKILLIQLTDPNAKGPLHYDLVNEAWDYNFADTTAITKVENTSLEGALQQLKALPQLGQFDRIEIGVHGRPDKIRLHTSDLKSAKDLRGFAELNLAAPDAELVMRSCFTGQAKIWGAKAEDNILKVFANHFLKQGGRAYGTSKLMYYSKFPRPVYDFTPAYVASDAHSLFNHILPQLKYMKTFTRPDVVTVHVPAPHARCQALDKLF